MVCKNTFCVKMVRTCSERYAITSLLRNGMQLGEVFRNGMQSNSCFETVCNWVRCFETVCNRTAASKWYAIG